MSKRKNRQCKKKRKYSTQKEAVLSLMGQKKKGLLSESHHTYKCNICKKWHIGRPPRNKKKVKKLWQIL